MYWKKWAAKHGYEELKEAWLEPGQLFCVKKNEGKLDWKSIAIEPGRFSWKVEGRRRDYLMLVGRISVNVKHARRRKAQKNTGSTTAQNGTKSDGRFPRFPESGSKKQEPQRRSGSGKEALLNIFSVKANGRGHLSVRKCESEKHKSWSMPAEGFKGHVATDGSLSGKLGKWGAWAVV